MNTHVVLRSILCSLVFLTGVDQGDGCKMYVFTFLEIPSPSQPVGKIYISNPSTRVAYVHIRTPLIAAGEPGYVSEDFHIMPASSANVTVTDGDIQHGSRKTNKGIVVCSSQDVSIQALSTSTITFISDGYSVPPPSRFGTDYVITSYSDQCLFDYWWTLGPYSLSITGLTDVANVRVTVQSPCSVPARVTYNNVNYTNGDVIEETIGKYQTLQIQMVDPQGLDLTGTRVVSSSPILLTTGVGRMRVEGYSFDHMVDYVIPRNQQTMEYLFIATPTRLAGDRVRILAGAKATTYNLTDNLGVRLASGHLTPFTMVELNSTSERLYTVRTSAPVQVTLFPLSYTRDNVNSSDNCMLALHPMSHASSKFYFSTMIGSTAPYIHYIALIAPTTSTSQMLLNGKPIAGIRWAPFYNSTYSGTTVKLSDGVNFHAVTNSAGAKFLVYLHEMGRFEAAAMFIQPPDPEGNVTQALQFTLTASNVALASASLGCMTVNSKAQCASGCMRNTDYCGGLQYDSSTLKCCLLSDSDILTAARSTRKGAELWQWKDDVTMCKL